MRKMGVRFAQLRKALTQETGQLLVHSRQRLNAMKRPSGGNVVLQQL